jgi:hypothetical protein
MKEQKAAEAVPEEHEEQETKGIKAEEQPEVPSPHTPVVSTPTNRAMWGGRTRYPEILAAAPTPLTLVFF